jgi:hypothetical protein
LYRIEAACGAAMSQSLAQWLRVLRHALALGVGAGPVCPAP